MITKSHIIRRAFREGVPARTVERDYALTHIVATVAAQGDDSKLVFKGGTALRLCHFEDYRYSELNEHVPGDTPHFNDVQRRVARHLRRAGLL